MSAWALRRCKHVCGQPVTVCVLYSWAMIACGVGTRVIISYTVIRTKRSSLKPTGRGTVQYSACCKRPASLGLAVWRHTNSALLYVTSIEVVIVLSVLPARSLGHDMLINVHPEIYLRHRLARSLMQSRMFICPNSMSR